MLMGYQFKLGVFFFLGTVAVAGFFGYQQILIADRNRKGCFEAFLNNQWVGLVVFISIVADYAVRSP